MNLLVFTQKVNKNDQVLGFFHNWISKISQKVNFVYVICIEKGEIDLPKNVEVFELGKQYGINKINYIINFWKFLFKIKGKYQKVFVHMNQEYVLLGGLYWILKGIPVYMWRNHTDGSILTNIAVYFSKKVFCTSKFSYTARFAKTIIMPAGIDTDHYKQLDNVVRKKYSVVMVGRISPVKKIDLALNAVKILIERGVQMNFTILGPVIERDKDYFDSLKYFVDKNNLSKIVTFLDGVSPGKLPQVYSGYEICLNLSPDGSFDKTIAESASCGAIPLVANKNLRGMLPDICITGDDKILIADSIEKILQAHEQVKIHKDLESFVLSQSLDNLVNKLIKEIYGK